MQLEAQPHNTLASVDELVNELRAGRPIILVDDEDRENEGDLIVPADCITPGIITFMAKKCSGLICLAMEQAMIKRLGLKPIGRGDNTHHQTAFTVSIEAKSGITTGISSADRTKTILDAINPATKATDIATPGHIFPLIARDGGVLEREGHTEASVDLARMAGHSGAAVICEIIKDDGTMARFLDLQIFASAHGYKIGTIADLVAYRRQNG